MYVMDGQHDIEMHTVIWMCVFKFNLNSHIQMNVCIRLIFGDDGCS